MSVPEYQLSNKYAIDSKAGIPVITYMNEEYYYADGGNHAIKDINETYPSFMVNDENNVSLFNPQNMKSVKFTKRTKTQIVAHFILTSFSDNKYPDLVFDSLKLMNVDPDEFLNELLMTNSEFCLGAAKIILKAKCDLGMTIDIKETVFNKMIFEYMMDFGVNSNKYPNCLSSIRKTLENLWSKLTVNEKKPLREKAKLKIESFTPLLIKQDAVIEDIISNIIFFRQFI